jgi:hypothetical protein
MRIDNSNGKPYYTQRNNELHPMSACNVTAMINALVAAGWKLPETKEQPEDALLAFIQTNEECEKLWIKNDPLKQIPPNQWHNVLSLGVNLWLNLPIASINWKTNVVDIVEHLMIGGTCIASGLFPTTEGHFVAIVGTTYEPLDGSVSNFIIDDPWGDYRTNYKIKNGNSIEMLFEDYEKIIKPIDKKEKWVHFIKKSPARPRNGELSPV